jgi:hypothetical protein
MQIHVYLLTMALSYLEKSLEGGDEFYTEELIDEI